MLWQILSLAGLVVSVSSHGRVSDPPSRATMWRYGYPTPANYDDTGLYCGGFDRQYSVNNGKCGICGDAFDLSEPRPHEIGGKYGLGIIVAEYEAGQVIETTVEITAYHRGYWYFKICPNPNTNEQSCFDEYLLELEDGGTEYYPPSVGKYTVNYRLPKDLVCDHCVLQWRYVAGNNWGVCEDGSAKLGCGNQETFGACSDIKITKSTVDAVVGPIPVELDTPS
ncbi:uncharacterized protein LOC125069871 [Vanessa atalanta]|uniref:uncharacterized protein LOC125069871 n=1 Tax=Vanessa atalanta TaxID=42275 RepID=UPI001FCD1289|nr:uncharacterized protein LOC125069871 [Vanessa atalanta]